MFAGELTYDELYSELNQAIEEMPKHDLLQCLGDGGMVGEIAQEQARSRGWEFDVKTEHTGQLTSVSVQVSSFGDDEDEDDEDL